MNALIQSATRRALLGAALVAAATVLPGCTSQQMQGAGSSYLIVDALNASRGDADDFAGQLESDVIGPTGVVSDVATSTIARKSEPSAWLGSRRSHSTCSHGRPISLFSSDSTSIRAGGAEGVETTSNGDRISLAMLGGADGVACPGCSRRRE